jgi:hypothetical protein
MTHVSSSTKEQTSENPKDWLGRRDPKEISVDL